MCTLAYGIVKSLRLGGGKLKYFVFQQNGAGKKNQDIYRYIILLSLKYVSSISFLLFLLVLVCLPEHYCQKENLGVLRICKY